MIIFFNTDTHIHTHMVNSEPTSRYSVPIPKKAEQGLVKYFAAILCHMAIFQITLCCKLRLSDNLFN